MTATSARHRAALLLIVTQVVFAQSRPDTPTNPFAANPTAAIAAGKRAFDGICIACHGPGGSGTERAPALDAGEFKHGGEDFDLFQTIQKGVPGTQMPSFASFSPEQTWQFVSYVQSLSRVASASDSGPMLGDAARGEQLFFGAGQCSSCHEINGRGSALASDLSEIGKRSPAAIATAMEHPLPRHRQFGSRMHYVDVTLQDGMRLEGVAKSEDSFSIVLQTLDGNYRVLDRNHIRTITENERLVIPFDLAGKLSADQKADLLAYLSQRKQRADVSIDSAAASPGASFERLSHAQREPQNWLTYWGSYASEHFSPLQQIDRHNVSNLQAKWALPMPGSAPVEATPLVVDGLMYMSGPPGEVYALDARTGLKIWNYHRQQETVSPFR